MKAAPDGAATAFAHEAMLYRGTAGMVSGVVRFVQEGLDRGETVAVAVPADHLRLVRAGLDDVDAVRVLFFDMQLMGLNPGRIIDTWQRLVAEHASTGSGFRGVGEPAWVGRRDAELEECQLHEHLLNQAFDAGPAWRLMCPYDVENLPAAVTYGAGRTHPLCGDDGHSPAGSSPSAEYVHGGALAAFASTLPAPPAAARTRTYRAAADIAGVSREVADFARESGLSEKRIADLCVASSELASNSVRHAAGAGLLTMWREPDALVVQFADRGHISDPMVGRTAPRRDDVGGRGLYVTHQLCDLVQLRSSREGTTGRLTTWL